MTYEPNQVINQLQLIEEVYKLDTQRKRKYWKCKCLRCGAVKVIREDTLKEQQTCGCLSKATRSRYLFLKRKYSV